MRNPRGDIVAVVASMHGQGLGRIMCCDIVGKDPIDEVKNRKAMLRGVALKASRDMNIA